MSFPHTDTHDRLLEVAARARILFDLKTTPHFRADAAIAVRDLREALDDLHGVMPSIRYRVHTAEDVGLLLNNVGFAEAICGSPYPYLVPVAIASEALVVSAEVDTEASSTLDLLRQRLWCLVWGCLSALDWLGSEAYVALPGAELAV